MRTWAPLTMAAKVDLSTSTDWKEAKCKCQQEGGARGEGGPTWAFPGWTAPRPQPLPPGRPGEVKASYAPVWTPPLTATPPLPRAPAPPQTTSLHTRSEVRAPCLG